MSDNVSDYDRNWKHKGKKSTFLDVDNSNILFKDVDTFLADVPSSSQLILPEGLWVRAPSLLLSFSFYLFIYLSGLNLA